MREDLSASGDGPHLHQICLCSPPQAFIVLQQIVVQNAFGAPVPLMLCDIQPHTATLVFCTKLSTSSVAVIAVGCCCCFEVFFFIRADSAAASARTEDRAHHKCQAAGSKIAMLEQNL